jgi:hypothetical protein
VIVSNLFSRIRAMSAFCRVRRVRWTRRSTTPFADARPAFSDNSRGSKVVQSFFAYTFVLNQGFARVYVVASSAAMVLWSVRALRLGGGWRGPGILGCLVGAAAAAGVLSGGLPLNVHGFGAVVVAQSAWTIWNATRLSREE